MGAFTYDEILPRLKLELDALLAARAQRRERGSSAKVLPQRADPFCMSESTMSRTSA